MLFDGLPKHGLEAFEAVKPLPDVRSREEGEVQSSQLRYLAANGLADIVIDYQ